HPSACGADEEERLPRPARARAFALECAATALLALVTPLALRRRRMRPLDARDPRPPVVLLHGYAQPPANFTWLARRLRRDARLAAPRPPRRRRPRAAARRLHLDLLGRRRRRRPGEPRVLPGRVQHRGARARPPLPPLLAARLRAGAREPRRRARPRARRRRGRRTVAALTLTVGAGAVRLDVFLHGALPALSRRFVRRLIAEGAVCVNGRPAAKGVRVAPGDRVTLPDLPASITPEPQLALPVLHEDDAVVALDKPGGMPGHALDPRQRAT